MAETAKIEDWLVKAAFQVRDRAEQPALEAQVLLAHVLHQPRSWVIAHPEFSTSSPQDRQLESLLEKRQQGEPLPYLLGHWEFYGLDFLVNPDVLIPRPETELLVEEALHWIQARKKPITAIDVGTGSGCIAVSLATCSPGLHLLASDISRSALKTCAQNAARHGVQRQISLVQADLLEPFNGPFDLLCANLPYIPTPKLATLEVARHEPGLALDGGTDGLRFIEQLLAQAASRMAPAGLLLLEIEAGQQDEAASLASRYFPGASINVLPDLAGLPRLLRIETNQEARI